MGNLKIFEYEGSPIQFEVVDGKVMANATLMAKAFNKKPDDVFKTKSWKDYELALMEVKGMRFDDLRSVKNGENGGSWIHQELVIEFARKLNPRFAIWCNDKVADLLRDGVVHLKPLTPSEMFLQNAQILVEHDRSIIELKRDVEELKAKQITSPQNYYAVSGYAALYKINCDTTTAKKVGRSASRMCTDMGYVMGSVPDSKYGSVKTYPIDVLENVFRDMRLTR